LFGFTKTGTESGQEKWVGSQWVMKEKRLLGAHHAVERPLLSGFLNLRFQGLFNSDAIQQLIIYFLDDAPLSQTSQPFPITHLTSKEE
jgi:hypothetical protein